ncbi:Tetracyclin repressor, C-terminal all-alpha domain [Acidipropionibacterium jensenii]|uniref:Tetracyclin repressor, C-terminal all-alpha domain n=1 Tax=Acidipropionibacterium jensenii TaxID=1749 RepID=A0A3S4VHZ3_9ACTN|nr:Tetracyclin repressor, C-terminal all-alpha domain [Acidipropionibacterium jensenii]
MDGTYSHRQQEVITVTERTGTGDPLQSIALLWRTNPRTGRSSLTLDAIVEAAIAVATEAGIDKLSMRRIAERVGVGVMSLYQRVPGKGELIDLMVDHVNGGVYDTATRPDATNGWRPAVEEIAARNWELFAQHPWLLGIDTTRPPLGPGTTAKYDLELTPLVGTGLSDVEIDQVLALVLDHVKAASRVSLGVAETTEATGSDDHDWWTTAGPLLAALIDDKRFPHASRIGAAAGAQYDSAVDGELQFDFGLRMILDGVEKLIASKQDASQHRLG